MPAAAKLLHRAVGMNNYALCEVLNVSTLSLEILLDRPLPPGTVVTVLAPPEGPARKYQRVVGRVERREERDGRWMHVVKAPSRRPWSPMFLFNVIYQTLAGSGEHNGYGVMHAQDADGLDEVREDRYLEMLARTARGAEEARVPADIGVDSGDPILYRALAWLSPFHQLNDLMRQFIAREQAVTRMPAGTTLVERGSSDDVSIFLLEGVLEVEAFDGRRTRIVAGTRPAQFPISLLKPHAYTVKAATEVAVVLLSQEMVRRVSRLTATRINNTRHGIEVSEVLLAADSPLYPGSPGTP